MGIFGDDVEIVQVERGNTVLRISKDDVQRYLDQGYNLIDSNGNVLKASVPRDLGTLQKAYVDHTNKIKELEEEIAKLKSTSSTGRKKKTAIAE